MEPRIRLITLGVALGESDALLRGLPWPAAHRDATVGGFLRAGQNLAGKSHTTRPSPRSETGGGRYGAMVGKIQPSLTSMERDLSSSPSSQEAKSSSEKPSMRWFTLSKKGTLFR